SRPSEAGVALEPSRGRARPPRAVGGNGARWLLECAAAWRAEPTVPTRRCRARGTGPRALGRARAYRRSRSGPARVRRRAFGTSSYAFKCRDSRPFAWRIWTHVNDEVRNIRLVADPRSNGYASVDWEYSLSTEVPTVMELTQTAVRAAIRATNTMG